MTATEIRDLHDMWRMGVLRGVHVTSDWTSYVETHRGPAASPPVVGYVDRHGANVYWPGGRIPRPGADISAIPGDEADVQKWVHEHFIHVDPGTRVDVVTRGDIGSNAIHPLDPRAAELVHRYPEVFEGHHVASGADRYAEAWHEHASRLETAERLDPGTLTSRPAPTDGFIELDGTFQLPPHTPPEQPAVDAHGQTQPNVDVNARIEPAVDPHGLTQPGDHATTPSAREVNPHPIAEPGPAGYRPLTVEEALDVRAAFGQAGVRHGVASATAGFDEYRANHAISHPGEALPMNGYVDGRGVHFYLLPDNRIANPDASPPPARDASEYHAWLQAHTTEVPSHQLLDLARRHPAAIIAGVTVDRDTPDYQRHYLENMLAGRVPHGEADHLRALEGHHSEVYDARLRQLAIEHNVPLEAPAQGYRAGRALHLPPAPTEGSIHDTHGQPFRPLTRAEAIDVHALSRLDQGMPHTQVSHDWDTYRAEFQRATHSTAEPPLSGYVTSTGDIHVFHPGGRLPHEHATPPPGSVSHQEFEHWLRDNTGPLTNGPTDAPDTFAGAHVDHRVADLAHRYPSAFDAEMHRDWAGYERRYQEVRSLMEGSPLPAPPLPADAPRTGFLGLDDKLHLPPPDATPAIPPESHGPPAAVPEPSGTTLAGHAPPPGGVHPPQSGVTFPGVAPPAPPGYPHGAAGGPEVFRALSVDEARTVGAALDHGGPAAVGSVGVTSAVGDFASYRAAFEHAHPGHAVPMAGYRDASGVHIYWTPGRVPNPDAPPPPRLDGSPASEAAHSQWLNQHTSAIPEHHLGQAITRDPHLVPNAARMTDADDYAFAYRRSEVFSSLAQEQGTMLRRLEKLESNNPDAFRAEIDARAQALGIGDPPTHGFLGQHGEFTFLDTPHAPAPHTAVGDTPHAPALSTPAGLQGDASVASGQPARSLDATEPSGVTAHTAEHVAAAEGHSLANKGAQHLLGQAVPHVGGVVGGLAAEWVIGKLGAWATAEVHRATDPLVRSELARAEGEIAQRVAEARAMEAIPGQPVWATFEVIVSPQREMVGHTKVSTGEFTVRSTRPEFTIERPEASWEEIAGGGARVVVSIPQNPAAADIDSSLADVRSSLPDDSPGIVQRVANQLHVLPIGDMMKAVFFPERHFDDDADAQTRDVVRDVVTGELPQRQAEIADLARSSEAGAVWGTVTITIRTQHQDTIDGRGGSHYEVTEVSGVQLATMRPAAGVEQVDPEEIRIHVRIAANDAARLVDEHEREHDTSGGWFPAPHAAAEPPTPDSAGFAGAAKQPMVMDKEHTTNTPDATHSPVATHPTPYGDHGPTNPAAYGNPYAPIEPISHSTDHKHDHHQAADDSHNRADHHPAGGSKDVAPGHKPEHLGSGSGSGSVAHASTAGKSHEFSTKDQPSTSHAGQEFSTHDRQGASDAGYEFSTGDQHGAGHPGHEFSDPAQRGAGDAGHEFSSDKHVADYDKPHHDDPHMHDGRDDIYQAMASGSGA